MFPEQCVKHLKEKFHLGELNIRELMYVMKHMGIKTIKVHTNGNIYDVFLRRDVNGVQDFEFINTLVQYRKEKRIKDEWSKEPITDYTPEMSNMKNASDDLLKNDDIYFENEDRKFMNQDNKKLYESIITSVAKEVKKALNEDEYYKSPINTTLGNNNTKNLNDQSWLQKNANGLAGIGMGIQGLSGLANAYMGYKNYLLAKDQFNYQKGLANRNLANQAKIINNKFLIIT